MAPAGIPQPVPISRKLTALAAAVPAGTLLAGAEAGALCALGLAGFVAGLHLHRVVAEQYIPR